MLTQALNLAPLLPVPSGKQRANALESQPIYEFASTIKKENFWQTASNKSIKLTDLQHILNYLRRVKHKIFKKSLSLAHCLAR